jgi:hypothetical protein
VEKINKSYEMKKGKGERDKIKGVNRDENLRIRREEWMKRGKKVREERLKVENGDRRGREFGQRNCERSGNSVA